jgi:radical SAM superfamily enzyme YgiQ (UPF0313 family)
MKVVLGTLNSKFIHSSLALAYLEAACGGRGWELEVMEFTINESMDDIMASLYLSRPDVLCFSAYIWNIENILWLCRDLKKVSPNCIIILGGPEVSYDAGQVLLHNPAVDYIVRGEGEITLPELLEHILRQESAAEVKGISYRRHDQLHENPSRELIANLDSLASPFKKDFTGYQDRIIYYESSRGCPFNCSYCLSSSIKGVRYFPLARVKEELGHLLSYRLRELKFVDRTFNSDEARAREIMSFIIGQKPETKVHLEICAEIISPEFMDFLSQVPPGLFNFEIGIQSTCPQALQAVRRYHNWERLRQNILQLQSFNNIHLHLDLIAGLPLESYDRFQQSFNDVYRLQPDMLQLGFLKLLKGSDIYRDRHRYQYRFQSRAPYQVLSHGQITYDEIISLDQIEEVLNRYYNHAIVPNTLDYVINRIYQGNAFMFFRDLAQFWSDNNLFGLGHRREREYDIMLEFLNHKHPHHGLKCNELIKYDFLICNLPHRFPAAVKRINPSDSRERLNTCLRSDTLLEQLPELIRGSRREITRHLHLEYFVLDPFNLNQGKRCLPLLFVYHPIAKKAIKILKLAETGLQLQNAASDENQGSWDKKKTD